MGEAKDGGAEENDVSGGSQEDSCGPTSTVGEG
jgi:hypothetical protein